MFKPLKREVKCLYCEHPFMARDTDLQRGWGKFCSRPCADTVARKGIKLERVAEAPNTKPTVLSILEQGYIHETA